MSEQIPRPNKSLVLGTFQDVSFPEFGGHKVSAKIDTGAYSGAMHCSSIRELKDVGGSYIVYKPFDVDREFRTSNFTVKYVRSSNGEREKRYFIDTSVEILGEKYDILLSLSNRSAMKWPVLIGRRFLKQHGILVDATKPVKSETRNILMISTRKTFVTSKFASNLESHGKSFRVKYISYADLVFVQGPGNNQVRLLEDSKDVADFDLVHFKTSARYQDVAASVAKYLEARNVKFIDTAIKHFPATSKLYQQVILADNNMSVPKSVFMLMEAMSGAYSLLKTELGSKIVLKDIHGNKGEHNYLVENEQSFNDAIKEAEADNVHLIAQEFIPNACDYRVLIFGDQVAMVIKRERGSDETHLNNTSKGATATIVQPSEIPKSLLRTSVRVVRILQREVAGVDLVQDKNSGIWYCFEVNDGPQIASGSFTAEKNLAFAEYLDRRLEGKK